MKFIPILLKRAKNYRQTLTPNQDFLRNLVNSKHTLQMIVGFHVFIAFLKVSILLIFLKLPDKISQIFVPKNETLFVSRYTIFTDSALDCADV